MSKKQIISTLLALPHYPNKDPQTLADLDVLTDIVTAVAQKDTPSTDTTAAKSTDKPCSAKDFKDIIISALYHKKLQLESTGKQELSFYAFRDRLICVFVTLMTMTTVVLFVSSPSELFPKWYTIAVPLMLFTRIIDYSQKKEHFFLIDFCYTAGLQILYFLMVRPNSIHLATRAFAFGAGTLGWSTILFSNGLAIHRLDEFCSLWIHTVPSFLAYTLRWTNEKSVIYYGNAAFAFSSEHMVQYLMASYIPYLIWVVGYYFIINKAFKHMTVDGDYMTLVKYVMKIFPESLKFLDIFGPKYRGEAFMMYHVLYFSVVNTIGYFCFFNRTLHTLCFGLCVSFAIFNGAKSIVNDLFRPYQLSLDRINSLLATLGQGCY